MSNARPILNFPSTRALVIDGIPTLNRGACYVNRNLHKMPRTVRKLDGALTAWRYFHGPNFVYEARDWRRRGLGVSYIAESENMALFEVLYRFVKWMNS